MHAIGIWLNYSTQAGIIERKLELKGHKTYTGGRKEGRKYLSGGNMLAKTQRQEMFSMSSGYRID